MKTMTRLALLTTLLLGGCSLVINSSDYTGGEPGDGGVDAAMDTGMVDTGMVDTGMMDTGMVDSGMPTCSVCGAGEVMSFTGHCVAMVSCPGACSGTTPVCDPVFGACVLDDCVDAPACGPNAECRPGQGCVPMCECEPGKVFRPDPTSPTGDILTCQACDPDSEHWSDVLEDCLPGNTMCGGSLPPCPSGESCATFIVGDGMWCMSDGGGTACSGRSDCAVGEFCDMTTSTCRPEPTCPASCAGACVHGRCLGAGGEPCTTDPLGFLVRGGPVPRCGGLMAPGAGIDVAGRGMAQRVGPYPVSSGISGYRPESLRVFADDTNPDRVRFVWADLAEVQFGELRVSNDGSPPDVCVVAEADPFLNHICSGEGFDASAVAFDLQNVGSTNYAAFGGSANVDLYRERPDGCFTHEFTSGATDASHLAIIGGGTATTPATVAYWSGGALTLADSAGTRALAPALGVPYETPLVGAGSFLLFGMKNVGEPAPSMWANTIWNLGWGLSETAPGGLPSEPLSAASADPASIFSGWEDVASGQVELQSASDCATATMCNGPSAAGASLITTSPLPLGIAAEPGGGALAVFGDSATSGDLAVMLDDIAADGAGASSPVPLLRGDDVGGRIVDILGIAVATNTVPDGGTAWEIDYGVMLKVSRAGAPETTELWGGALRFCTAR